MNRLLKMRKRFNLTLDELSEQINIPRATLSRYENGTSEPKQETWNILAGYFSVSVPYIMGIDEQEEGMISISVHEYKRLKDIESKMNMVKEIIN